MTATEVQVAAAMEAAEEHYLFTFNNRCHCGDWEAGVSPFDAVRQHARHLAREIANAVVAAGPDPAKVAAEALREAAERLLAYDDEADVHDAAGTWMQLVHGGYTGKDADWREAYAKARGIPGNRPESREDFGIKCHRYGQVKALREASDAIQAMHPGEVKNSVVWLRARADRIEAGQ